MDLLDLGTPRLTFRRCWSLIEQLPLGSRYHRAVVGEAAVWGHTEHLLASVIDCLLISNWLYVSAHSKNRQSPPKLITRPGVADRDGRIGGGVKYSPAEMRELLGTFEERATDAEVTTTEVG